MTRLTPAPALLFSLGLFAAAGSEQPGAVTDSSGAAAVVTRGSSGLAFGAVTGTPSLLRATPHGTPIDLKVDPELESAIRDGQDLILDRKYDQGLVLFATVGKSHPDSPVGPVGEMMVWQSQMLENGDFAHTDEYEAATKEAGARISAVKSPGAWDRMLEGGYFGVKGMHAMRGKHWLKAATDGWSALSDMKALKKNSPSLADSDVGLGAYDYWRSVITHNSRWLPFFSDKRKQGIAELERAFVDAQYTRRVAEIVLIYIYLDEKNYDAAISLGEDMAQHYPHNTDVRIQLGRAYSRQMRYAEAVAIDRRVLELQPDNKSVSYYLGANLMYEGKHLDEAEKILTDFVDTAPGTDWRRWANERLGDLWMKRGDPDRAVSFWKKSLKDVSDDDGVKNKIAHAHDPVPVGTPTPGKGPGSLP